jgi:hypothetical protein
MQRDTSCRQNLIQMSMQADGEGTPEFGFEVAKLRGESAYSAAMTSQRRQRLVDRDRLSELLALTSLFDRSDPARSIQVELWQVALPGDGGVSRGGVRHGLRMRTRAPTRLGSAFIRVACVVLFCSAYRLRTVFKLGLCSVVQRIRSICRCGCTLPGFDSTALLTCGTSVTLRSAHHFTVCRMLHIERTAIPNVEAL